MRQRVHTSALPGWIDPAAAYRALSDGAEASFWLDSGPDAISGMSYLGAAGARVSYRIGEPLRVSGPDGASELPGTIFELLDRWSAEAVASRDGLGPFQLGLVGFLGYELHRLVTGSRIRAEDAPWPARPHPDAMLLRIDRMLAIDHERQRLTLLACAEHDEEAAAWFAKARALLARISEEPARPAAPPPEAVPRWASSDEEYLEQIRACQQRIHDGDAYQLCLTTRVRVDGAFDPLTTFESLRQANPTHHSALIRTPEVSLLSSSPEQFLDIAPDRRIRTSPIKGTRPRDVDPVQDARLARELLESEKERAENLMIVDLMRNDLGRVCELGTVAVSRLLEVESYRTVHQLVSTVEGRLRADAGLGEVLSAVFPAGSMTGAPKHRAIELLDGLEPTPRGIYAGAFGYLGRDGRVDLGMTIRSIVLDSDGATIGTGGGITAGSVPEEELAEAKLKADALLRVLGAAAP